MHAYICDILKPEVLKSRLQQTGRVIFFAVTVLLPKCPVIKGTKQPAVRVQTTQTS